MGSYGRFKFKILNGDFMGFNVEKNGDLTNKHGDMNGKYNPVMSQIYGKKDDHGLHGPFAYFLCLSKWRFSSSLC